MMPVSARLTPTGLDGRPRRSLARSGKNVRSDGSGVVVVFWVVVVGVVVDWAPTDTGATSATHTPTPTRSLIMCGPKQRAYPRRAPRPSSEPRRDRAAVTGSSDRRPVAQAAPGPAVPHSLRPLAVVS